MYQEVADKPEGTFHFYHGREAAELFGYAPEWLGGDLATGIDAGNPFTILLRPEGPRNRGKVDQ